MLQKYVICLKLHIMYIIIYKVPKNSVILLKGTSTLTLNDEDIEYWDVH